MTAKKMIGLVKYKENLAGSTWLVEIEFDEELNFLPGQFVSIKVSEEGLRRSYSVANQPGKKSIDLVVNVAPMGVGSKYILGLKTGDFVEALGFLGKFVVGDDVSESRKEMVFVGTGTGVVPLRPMIEDLLVNKGYKGQVHLIWGMRYETDIFWLKEIRNLERDYDNFHFSIALSKPTEKWPGVGGHVGDIIEAIDLKGTETNVYLCGRPEMIDEMKNVFIKKGVPETQILNERYA